MTASIYLFTLVAFVGGIVSFLSPCTAVILPAFFANTFKQRTDLFKATLLFFLGLAAIYIPLGLSGTFLARLIFINRNLIGPFLGIVFTLTGLLLLLGKIFHLPNLSAYFERILPARFQAKLAFSSFGMGVLSGLGSTPCAGPVLGVILTLAAASQSFVTGTFLMFVYALGLFVPLFVLAFWFDKTPRVQKILQGKIFRLSFRGWHWQIHSTNLLAAVLFLALGGLFLTAGNSSALTSWYAQKGFLDVIFDLQEKLTKILY